MVVSFSCDRNNLVDLGLICKVITQLIKRKMHLFSTSICMIVLASLVHSTRQYFSKVETSYDDFEIKLGIIENNNSFVNISCKTHLWTNFPALDFNHSSVAVIIFENCSFPTRLNLQNLVDSMNIKVEKEFTFRNLQSFPSRENLKGIIVPNLNLNVNRPDDISSDLLYDMYNLRSLSLNAQLARIPDSFFADWAQNLSVVFMKYNKLRKIAKKDFARFINLKNMDLSDNAIDEIEPKAFDSLIKLNSLDLSLNPLHTLPLGVFHRMTSLVKIKLYMNSFDKLPEGLLQNNKNLEEFVMDENQGNLTTLPHGFFKNLIHLKIVSLRLGRWENLPSDLFVGCSTLDSVNLYGSHLTTLPSSIFNYVKNLRLLDVGGNRLTSLPPGIFKGLDRLQHLLIGNNRLTSLKSEVLEDLESLECIDASHNRLTHIDDQFIRYLKLAKNIVLSNNQLTFESQDTIGLLEYQKAPSSMNNLNGPFINVSDKQNVERCRLDPRIILKNVNLMNNNITEINTELINIMKYSVFVDLGYNRISKINLSELSSKLALCNETYADEDREYLKIRLINNTFHCDCNILEFANYLKDPRGKEPLYIFATEYYFGKGFKCASPPEFKDREIFDLRTQELDCLSKITLPEAACAETCVCRRILEKRILSVDCSNKNLTHIPPLIENTQNWFIELNMSSNNLYQLPSPSVSYWMNVISLDLSNNNIGTVTLDLFSSNLQHLKLHGNRITRLDSNVLEHLEQENVLLDLTLHDNKWICDCDAHKLVTFVQKKFTYFRFDKVKCYETNIKLHKMTVRELCEDIIAIIVIASLSIVFFAIVIASTVVLYYKYQREIKVWLYSKHCCLWFVAEDDLDKDKEYDAFISFSHKDEDFVEKEIVAKLEKGPRPYKLCLHYRDWLAGEWIPIQISRSVAESRRTIVILTPNFLESVWGLLEFRTAHTQALKEGRARLIVIIYGDIGNIDDLDQEMKDYLRLNTYIKWGDPWFWKKLEYALPHTKQFDKSKMRNFDNVENRLIRFPLAYSCGSDVMGKPNVVSIPSTPQISTNITTGN